VRLLNPLVTTSFIGRAGTPRACRRCASRTTSASSSRAARRRAPAPASAPARPARGAAGSHIPSARALTKPSLKPSLPLSCRATCGCGTSNRAKWCHTSRSTMPRCARAAVPRDRRRAPRPDRPPLCAGLVDRNHGRRLARRNPSIPSPLSAPPKHPPAAPPRPSAAAQHRLGTNNKNGWCPVAPNELGEGRDVSG
jgi:hypothetical protein